jgi:beta-lactamase class A
MARIELENGGRLGVAVQDTGSGARAGHRDGERFPMCSTFKLLAAAAVLKRVDGGNERLDRRVVFTASDIVVNSPITKEHVGGNGMTLVELCEAAMTVSDNTAGNLILASLGGPQAITDYARTLGDTMTRLDRIEPDLNEAVPGDPRDTTTPQAMLQSMCQLVLGNALPPLQRAQLKEWMLGNTTGGDRIRAGVPPGWPVADKTGSGSNGTVNDIGVIWPPGKAPILLALYLTQPGKDDKQRNDIIAAASRIVVDAFSA